MRYYEALANRAAGEFSGMSGHACINRDEFYKMASSKFSPASDIRAVTQEADRLRSLARDINELEAAGLIKQGKE